MHAAVQQFGANVRAAREARGWTQEELAHRTGLAVVQVSRIERGVREVRLTTVLRLITGLEARPDDLLHETGRREIIGLDVGAAETEAFWTEFLRSLVARGLVGVQLAISDAHPGLQAAIARVLGAPWQRCTVHFLRDLRGHCRKDQHDALGALIRQIFTAPNGAEARRRLGDAASQLQPRLPKIAALLEDAEDDVLAFYAFPAEHWPKLRSTNPLERFNREIARRTDVVGISPTTAH